MSAAAWFAAGYVFCLLSVGLALVVGAWLKHSTAEYVDDTPEIRQFERDFFRQRESAPDIWQEIA